MVYGNEKESESAFFLKRFRCIPIDSLMFSWQEESNARIPWILPDLPPILARMACSQLTVSQDGHNMVELSQ
jgi:hypothetical protein